MGAECEPSAGGSGPVSYTHLDVYKRQSLGRAAQTQTPAVKATGVGDARVRRSMADLRPVATFRVGGDPDWMAVTADAVWVAVDKRNACLLYTSRCV